MLVASRRTDAGRAAGLAVDGALQTFPHQSVIYRAGEPLQTALEYGAAHGALAMTTPGDTTMVTKAEVLKLASGGGARVDR